MARPTKFTTALAETICERIAAGESLIAICSEGTMPDKSAVYRWLSQDEDFAGKYRIARELQADSLFDEILQIADTPQIGERTKTDKDGNTETTEGDMIEHRRLQIDARKFMAAKLKPKKYGDRLEIEARIDVDLAERLERARRRLNRDETKQSS